MNILITGVGGPTPRSFAIALKKYGNFKNMRLIATDINRLSIGLYQKELFDASYIIPRAGADNYWLVINDIVKKENIDLQAFVDKLYSEKKYPSDLEKEVVDQIKADLL